MLKCPYCDRPMKQSASVCRNCGEPRPISDSFLEESVPPGCLPPNLELELAHRLSEILESFHGKKGTLKCLLGSFGASKLLFEAKSISLSQQLEFGIPESIFNAYSHDPESSKQQLREFGWRNFEGSGSWSLVQSVSPPNSFMPPAENLVRALGAATKLTPDDIASALTNCSVEYENKPVPTVAAEKESSGVGGVLSCLLLVFLIGYWIYRLFGGY